MAEPSSLELEEKRVLTNTMLEINEKGWGIAVGLTLALGLFVATNLRHLERVRRHRPAPAPL